MDVPDFFSDVVSFYDFLGQEMVQIQIFVVSHFRKSESNIISLQTAVLRRIHQNQVE